MIVKTVLNKNFLKGYGSVLNLDGAKEWPDISRERQRDYEALRGDWYNVGRNIREGTRNFKIGRASCRERV